MWPLRRKPDPLLDETSRVWFALPFVEWSEDDVARMSRAIRIHGQPDSEGWRRQARTALNAMRTPAVVREVARVLAQASNPTKDVDRVFGGGHYMSHLPLWCAFLATARPAIEAMTEHWRWRADSGD